MNHFKPSNSISKKSYGLKIPTYVSQISTPIIYKNYAGLIKQLNSPLLNYSKQIYNITTPLASYKIQTNNLVSAMTTTINMPLIESTQQWTSAINSIQQSIHNMTSQYNSSIKAMNYPFIETINQYNNMINTFKNTTLKALDSAYVLETYAPESIKSSCIEASEMIFESTIDLNLPDTISDDVIMSKENINSKLSTKGPISLVEIINIFIALLGVIITLLTLLPNEDTKELIELNKQQIEQSNETNKLLNEISKQLDELIELKATESK